MKPMTRTEKEQFSAYMAAVFAPPDETLLAELEKEGTSLLAEGEISLAGLKGEYHRLFSCEKLRWGRRLHRAGCRNADTERAEIPG